MGSVVPLKEPREQGTKVELRKPHIMVVLLPRSGGMTLIGRRLYTAMLQFSQAELGRMSELPRSDHLFEAPLVSMLRVGGSESSARTLAKRYFKDMQHLQVDWESTAPGDGLKWRGFNMLAQAEISVREGQTWLAWAFPPAINGALREPDRWAYIDLTILFRLTRYASHALYEICSRYRDNPSGVTGRKPVTWWEAALSVEPRETERSDWRKFKFRAVKDAVLEINAETDLEIELIEHKQGRLVTEVQFRVRRKRGQQVVLQNEAPIDAQLVERAAAAGIPEQRLDRFLLTYGEAAVRLGLSALDERVENARLRPVDSAAGWLEKVLRAQKDTRDEPKPALPAADAQPSSTARALTVPSTGPDLARLHQLKQELAALSPERRDEFAARAVQNLQERKLLTPSVARRAKQGDYMVGILGAELVRVYGLATYGGDWQQMDVLDAPAVE